MLKEVTNKMNTSDKNRIVWIDWAKTILIYLMFVGHSPLPSYLRMYIYAFHMPAFFIISGYLYRQHNWLKTLKSFIVPIISLSLVNLLIYELPKICRGTFDSADLMYRCLIPFVGGNVDKNVKFIILFPGVWFLIALMTGRFLIGDIKIFSPLLKYKYLTLTILLIFLVIEPFILKDNPLRDYKVYRVIPALPFILFGCIMKDKIDISKLKPWVFVIILLSFLILTYIEGDCDMLDYRFNISYLLYYINAIFGSLSLYYVCSKLKYSNVIRVLSTGTIFILAFNFNFISLFRFFFARFGLYDLLPGTVLSWFSGIVMMVLCYYPVKWLLKYCPTLLGK
jgi:acyltransferase